MRFRKLITSGHQLHIENQMMAEIIAAGTAIPTEIELRIVNAFEMTRPVTSMMKSVKSAAEMIEKNITGMRTKGMVKTERKALITAPGISAIMVTIMSPLVLHANDRVLIRNQTIPIIGTMARQKKMASPIRGKKRARFCKSSSRRSI
jgi:hypothetical protein